MDAFARQRRLKEAIRRADPCLGVFIKTPAVQLVEAVAGTGLDFVVLDAEHGPFGASELDHCILAARAYQLPVLVRVRESTPAAILEVLDMGAAGIIAPHIASRQAAEELVSACRYHGGQRGFSGLSRPSSYGQLAPGDYRRASDSATIIIAQIEDQAAVDNIAAIAALDELDALFIGRADLSVSLGADEITDPPVAAAVQTVLDAARQQGRTAGIFLPSAAETAHFRGLGASLFAISTDQGLLIDAVTGVVRDFRTAISSSND